MKKIIYGLLALVFAALIAFVVFFDTIGKNIAERYASKYLKTDVVIGELSTNWFDKKARISDINVANPKGFSQNNAFSLGNFSLTIGETDEVVVIKKIAISNVNLLLEQNNTQFNLHQLYQNITTRKNKHDNRRDNEAQHNDYDSNKKSKKIIIERLSFNKISVTINSQLLQQTIVLPNIKLTGLGKAENGITADEMIEQIIATLLAQIQTGIEKQGLSLFNTNADKLKEQLEDQVDKLQENLNQEAQKLLQNLGVEF